MLKLKKVAITGGIACGKTSVCQIFKELGAYVISADEVVHHYLSHNPKIIKKVGDLLGTDVIAEGRIDRRAVANKVFHNSHLLDALERILHPEVEKEIETQFQKIKKEGRFPLFVAEIPLFFESGSFERSQFDAVVVVEAPKDLCYERTKWSREDFNRRNDCQIPIEEKLKQADFVVHNSKGKEFLQKQVETIYQTLTS